MSEKVPYYSIIIPVYNVGTYVENTIKSILRQEFNDYEIIIIDDGSTDKTKSICSKYAEQHKDKITFKECIHKGVSSARNEGIRIASGKYIMFVDGDDYISEKTLSLLYENLNSLHPDVLYFGFTRTDKLDEKDPAEYGKKYNIVNVSKHEAIMEKLYKKTIPCYAACFRNNIIQENAITFDENLMYAEDALFLFTCMMHSESIISYEAELYFYYQRPESLTHIKSFPLSVTKMELKAWKKIRKLLQSDTELTLRVDEWIRPLRRSYYKKLIKGLLGFRKYI